MGMTISEKILSRACGADTVTPGDIVWCKVDRAMMDDILGPRVEIDKNMAKLHAKIWDKEKVVIISDHYTPPANVKQAEIVKFTREWAKQHDVDNYYEYLGPCHQVMVEKGHVLPGDLIVGTDSHTCTYGALGSFATGIGSTEMSGVLATGEIWLKVPQSIKVQWTGELNTYVMAKDMVLKTIGKIGHEGATYKAIEFTGNTIENLIIDERLAIANMAVEMGAKNGIIQADDKVRDYLKNIGITKGLRVLESDENAQYCATYQFDANKLEPMVSCPHEVDNVSRVKDIGKVRIDQVYIGSCTGGRFHDLKVAADILKGKKIKKGLRLLVSPASAAVYKECLKSQVLEILADAGATILAPSCGACLGLHSGTLAAGEVCISTTNRNFIGRMGSKESFVYLSSSATAAASALTGIITDPRVVR